MREEHSVGHMDVLYGEATTAFMAVSKMPTMPDVLNVMPVLERFVVLLYDQASQCLGVNDAPPPTGFCIPV